MKITLDSYKTISKLKKSYYKMIIEEAKNKFNWYKENELKNIQRLRSLFNTLIKWNILEYNPILKIRINQNLDKEANIYPTNEEQLLMRNH